MRRINLDGVLDSAFRIRPGEARQVGLMFLYLMGVVSTFIMGRTVRDTLFLHRMSLGQLPLMYVAVAFAVGFTAYAYSRIADRHRRDVLIVSALGIFAGVTALFWVALLLELGGGWLYPLLYVAIEIVGALSIIQFWTFANDIFSGRQAKRLFGVIGAGGVMANILCGFAVGGVVPVLGPENLLLVIAAVLTGCIVVVRAIAARARADLENAVRKPRKSKIGLASDGDAVLHSRHLQIIAAIVGLTFLTVTVIDYQFKVLARSAFHSEAEMASYFGYFYGFTGIIASAVQFFVTGRVLERAGIVASLLVLPAAITLGAGAILFVPLISAVVAVTLAKGAENIFRYTVNDATMQLLYVPVPSHQRGRAKAFIDGILKPASIGVSGLLLLLGGRFFEAEVLAHHLAFFDLLLLGGWIALVLRIRKEYVNSLIETLHARRFDLHGGWSPLLDEATLRTLKAQLRATNPTHLRDALEILPSLEGDFAEELALLLGHPETDIRIRAVRLLGGSGRLELVTRVQPLLEDPDPEVRAAAIGTVCAIGRERSIRAASRFLQDESPVVRAAAVTALIEHGGLDGILTAAEPLKGLLTHADAMERLQGARVLGRIRVRSFFQPVLELLQDPDPTVRLAAVEAAGEMQSLELVPSLIYKLGDRAVAEAASVALERHGRSIERTLFKVLDNSREDLAIRRRIPRILARSGDQLAAGELMKNLGTRDAELRGHIARALSRIRERSPGVHIDDGLLDAAIRREIEEAYQTLAVIEDLALPEGHLLPEALRVRHQRKLGLAFRLLEIRHPARTIQLVYANLDAESRAVRANALEVAENLLTKEEARLLMPLLEDQPVIAKLEAGARLFALERHPFEVWIGRLLGDGEAWVVSCTLHLVAGRGLLEQRERVVAHLEHHDPVVRETACLTLAALLRAEGQRAPEFDQKSEDLRRLAHRAIEDRVTEVRRAGDILLSALIPAPA